MPYGMPIIMSVIGEIIILKKNEGAAQTYVKDRTHKESSKFTQDLFATYKFDRPLSTQQQELQR